MKIISRGFLSELFASTSLLQRQLLNISSLSDEQSLAYRQHLKFLKPTSSDISDIVSISRKNVESFIAELDRMPTRNDKSSELDLINRIKGLDAYIKHSSILPEGVINRGELCSRAKLKRSGIPVTGLMNKVDDSRYCYEDFIFFHIDFADKNFPNHIEKADFTFKVNEEINSRFCMFLMDHHEIKLKNTLEDPSLFREVPKVEFGEVTRYLEVDGGARYKFCSKENEQIRELFTTRYFTTSEQFFFGEDVKNIMAILAIMHSRVTGVKYFLDDDDKKLSEKLKTISNFEIRYPSSLSIEGASYKRDETSKKLTSVEIAEKLHNKHQEQVSAWSFYE